MVAASPASNHCSRVSGGIGSALAKPQRSNPDSLASWASKPLERGSVTIRFDSTVLTCLAMPIWAMWGAALGFLVLRALLAAAESALYSTSDALVKELAALYPRAARRVLHLHAEREATAAVLRTGMTLAGFIAAALVTLAPPIFDFASGSDPFWLSLLRVASSVLLLALIAALLDLTARAVATANPERGFAATRWQGPVRIASASPGGAGKTAHRTSRQSADRQGSTTTDPLDFRAFGQAFPGRDVPTHRSHCAGDQHSAAGHPQNLGGRKPLADSSLPRQHRPHRRRAARARLDSAAAASGTDRAGGHLAAGPLCAMG